MNLFLERKELNGGLVRSDNRFIFRTQPQSRSQPQPLAKCTANNLDYAGKLFQPNCFSGFLRKRHPDLLLNGPGHKQPWTHGVYQGKWRGPAIGWVQNHRLEALHSYWLVTESKVLGSAFLLDSYRITGYRLCIPIG